jgi:hypothetical protein
MRPPHGYIWINIRPIGFLHVISSRTVHTNILDRVAPAVIGTAVTQSGRHTIVLNI